jgi:hypothetical protein
MSNTNPIRTEKLLDDTAVWLPAPVYNLLPLVYLVVGIATMLLIDSLFALLSGGMLMLAAALLWKWRRGWRRSGFAPKDT